MSPPSRIPKDRSLLNLLACYTLAKAFEISRETATASRVFLNDLTQYMHGVGKKVPKRGSLGKAILSVAEEIVTS